MDYRELLKKYMNLVAEEEGITFVGHNMTEAWEKLTDEEQAALYMIEGELR